MPKILLVEDTPDVSEVLQLALETKNHDVTVLGNYADALPVILAGDPDLLVADLVLPDGSGLNLAEEASRRGIPQLLITGNAQAAEHLEARGRRCLTKPFAFADFLDAVETLLRSASNDETTPPRAGP